MGLPILLGLVLGPLLAILIAKEEWLFVLPVAFAIPIAILLIRYPFAAIIIWMAVMPWFPFQDEYKYVYFIVHNLLIPLGLGIAFLSYILRVNKHQLARPKLMELATVVFGIMGVVSIFATGHHWKTLFKLLARSLVPFAAYWLIRLSNDWQQALKCLLPIVLLISLAECAIGLVSWFAPAVLPSIWHMRLFGSRITGTFNGAGPYGCVLIFFIVLLYHKAMNHEKGTLKTLLILTFALGMVCIFFTFTRAVWGAGILVLLGMLFLYPRATALLTSLILPIMVILSFTVLTTELAYAYERLHSEDTTQDRVILSTAGKDMFLARPILGWGYENYDRYDWKFMRRVGNIAPTKWQIQKGTSHNTYLTILAEMGVVGFTFYILPTIWWLIFTIKAIPLLPRKGFWSRRLLIVMWLPIIAQILIGQTSDLRFSYYTLTLFWINLGFIANMVQNRLEQTESNWNKHSDTKNIAQQLQLIERKQLCTPSYFNSSGGSATQNSEAECSATNKG